MEKTIHSEGNEEVTKILIDRRLRAHLTQRELAEKLNVTHSTIARIEQGERRLDIVEFITYCQALDCSPTNTFKKIAASIE